MSTASTDNYMQAMLQSFKPRKARGLRVTYHLNLSGSGGGDWTIAIENEQCSISRGRPSNADTAISMNTATYVKLAAGQLDVRDAQAKGDIKVGGNANHALALPNLFSPWADLANNLPAAPAPPTPAPVTPKPPAAATPPPVSPPQPQPTPTPTPTPAAPAVGSVQPQLMNGSFDEFQPYIRDGEAKDWNEFPERFGKYWNFNVISEAKKRVRLMDSETFGKFTQKYFGGGGHDYHIHGKHSQVITGRYGFDVVMSQSVAVKPGQSYTFSGSIVSFYKGTAGARKDGAIIKTIGVDPTGGQNWQSSSVVWGDKDGKDNEWRYPSLKVKAQANTMTVFIRIDNKEDDVGITELNIIHLENFKLE